MEGQRDVAALLLAAKALVPLLVASGKHSVTDAVLSRADCPVPLALVLCPVLSCLSKRVSSFCPGRAVHPTDPAGRRSGGDQPSVAQ